MSDTHYDPLEDLFDTEDKSKDTPADKDQGEELPAGSADQEKDDKEPEAKEEKQEDPVDPDADIVVDRDGVKMVPLAALREARERAKAAEARPVVQPKAETGSDDQDDDASDPFGLGPAPDREKDAAGYAEWLNANTNMTIFNDRLNRSEKDARREHGKEFTDTIRTWAMDRFEKDPAFTQRVMLSDDPYEVAIGIYNQETEDKSLRELPEEVRKGLSADELALIRDHRAKNAGGGDPENPPREEKTGRFTAQGQPRSRSPAPPAKSLVRATPAAGKGGGGRDAIAVGPGNAFDDTFG
jgi:hypothetical protein